MPAFTPLLPPTVHRAIDLIVVHCSATPSGMRLGAGRGNTPTAASVIDSWHQARGFRRSAEARNRWHWRLPSIGYHYVVDLDGYVWEGRHLDEIGAHAAGHNARSVGICLVGGREPDALYTHAQWESLRELVQRLQRLIGPLRICGHRDLSPDADGDGEVERHEWLKTCPGFDVTTWVHGDMHPLPGHIYRAERRA